MKQWVELEDVEREWSDDNPDFRYIRRAAVKGILITPEMLARIEAITDDTFSTYIEGVRAVLAIIRGEE